MNHFDLLKNNAVWGQNQSETLNSNLAFCFTDNITGVVNIKLTCSAIYRLTVNGKFIGYGPTRTAHGYSRVDEYSFSADGKVVIVVEAVNYNVNSYYLIKQNGYFTAVVENDDKVIATAKDFVCYDLVDRIKKVQRFSFQRPFVEAYSFAGERERLYLGLESSLPRLELEDAFCPTLLKRNMPYVNLNSKIAKCVESGNAKLIESKPVWKHRSITDIGETLLGFEYDDLDFYASDICSKFEYKKSSDKNVSSISLTTNQYGVFDFGRNLSGFVNLQINVKSDTEIFLTFDEIDFQLDDNINTDGINVCFNRNNCCNVIYWKLKKGKYNLLSIESNTLRFARVLSLGGAVDCSLGIVLYQNDSMYNLKFKSDNEKINRIVESAQHTIAQNSVDMLIDCPSRERAGWLNDSWFSCEAEKIVSGNVLANKSLLENLMLAPKLKNLPDGVFPMCYPSDHLDGNFCPTLICWTILDLLKYVDYTDDQDLYNKNKSKIYSALAYLEKFENEFGLLENLDGWVFIEWSKANDYIDGVHIPSNMLYYGTILKVAEKEYDPNLFVKAQKLKKTIIDLSFNGTFFEDHLVRNNGFLVKAGDVSEICQYFAFFFEIADKVSFKSLFNIVVNDFGPNRRDGAYPNVASSNLITGVYLREEILFREGLYNLLIQEIVDIFYPMAIETGTLWEGYDKGAESSDNHCISATSAMWLIKAITGFNSPKIGEYGFVTVDSEIKCEVSFPILDKYVTFKR